MDAFFFFFRACSLYVRRMVPSFIVELHKATKEDPLLVFERTGEKKGGSSRCYHGLFSSFFFLMLCGSPKWVRSLQWTLSIISSLFLFSILPFESTNCHLFFFCTTYIVFSFLHRPIASFPKVLCACTSLTRGLSTHLRLGTKKNTTRELILKKKKKLLKTSSHAKRERRRERTCFTTPHGANEYIYVFFFLV